MIIPWKLKPKPAEWEAIFEYWRNFDDVRWLNALRYCGMLDEFLHAEQPFRLWLIEHCIERVRGDVA